MSGNKTQGRAGRLIPVNVQDFILASALLSLCAILPIASTFQGQFL